MEQLKGVPADGIGIAIEKRGCKTFSTEVIERSPAKKTRLARPVSVREQKAVRAEFYASSAPIYACDR